MGGGGRSGNGHSVLHVIDTAIIGVAELSVVFPREGWASRRAAEALRSEGELMSTTVVLVPRLCKGGVLGRRGTACARRRWGCFHGYTSVVVTIFDFSERGFKLERCRV